MKVTFTYETISEKSAVIGEAEERGFLDPITGETFELFTQSEEYQPFDGGLVVALKEAQRMGCTEPSRSLHTGISDFWVSSVEPDKDHWGNETYYSVHFKRIGDRTLRRICKELGLKLGS